MLSVSLRYNELMKSDEFIKFGNGYSSVNFHDFGEGTAPQVSASKYALKNGKSNASKYTEDELIDMLKSGDYEDVYRAFGAISNRKLWKALSYLKNIALYDDDQEIQKEAIRTIRRIGGRKAFDTLRFLKTTEHREFVQAMIELKDIEDIDAC
jgi:hypothetical protein